jgi:hypothetical protein
MREIMVTMTTACTGGFAGSRRSLASTVTAPGVRGNTVRDLVSAAGVEVMGDVSFKEKENFPEPPNTRNTWGGGGAKSRGVNGPRHD